MVMMVKRENFVGAAVIIVSFLGVALPLVLCLEAGQDDIEPIFVNISSTEGNDTQCGMDHFTTQCHSLEYVARLVATNFTGSLTVYVLSPSPLVIEKTVVLKGLNEVKLIGYPSNIDIVCIQTHSDNPGLVFIAVDSVILENFSILGCGTVWNHTVSMSSLFTSSTSCDSHFLCFKYYH